MYKVTNKFGDVRRFRDGSTGKDVFVGPGESALTMRPPASSDVWNVEIAEEKLKMKKPKKEMKEDDSSSR